MARKQKKNTANVERRGRMGNNNGMCDREAAIWRMAKVGVEFYSCVACVQERLWTKSNAIKGNFTLSAFHV